VVVRLLQKGSDKDGDGKHEVHLELKTDGSAFVIEADSIKEAIDKLNDQIKLLAKKSPPSVQDKKKAEALDKAVKALADSVKKINAASSNAKDAKGKIEQKIIVLKQLQDKLQDEQHAVTHKLVQDEKIRAELEGRLSEALTQDRKDHQQVRVILKKSADEKVSDDRTAADRTAIRKQVEKLSGELREKRVELAAAQKRLSELEHEGGVKPPKTATTARTVTRSPFVGVITPDDPTQNRLEFHVVPDGRAVGGFVHGLPSSDQKRIDELEKKLQKLLDEVASLKKEKTAEKR
jgi:hypothetical protein